MLELLSVPVIIGLVEALKQSGMDSRFAPIVAIVIGLGVGLVAGDIITGLLLGLSASGVYSGAKAILK